MQSVYNGHPCACHGHPSTCAVFVLHSSVSEEMDFKDGVKLCCYLISPIPRMNHRYGTHHFLFEN